MRTWEEVRRWAIAYANHTGRVFRIDNEATVAEEQRHQATARRIVKALALLELIEKKGGDHERRKRPQLPRCH